MKKRRVVSIVLVLVIILSYTNSVSASSTLIQSEEVLVRIDELIDLAGRAARDGKLDLAYQYEHQIEQLGADILSVEEVIEMERELCNSTNTDQAISVMNVTKPTDSSAVHFYKTRRKYYYASTAQYYDIITIRAVSWDDTSNWLHDDGQIVTKKPHSFPLASAAASVVIGLILPERVALAVSLSDFLMAAGANTSNYTTFDIDENGGIATYSVDMEVRFQWICPYGSNDHVLRVRESKYSEINYTTTLNVKAKRNDGYTKTYSDSNTYFESYTPSEYGSLERVCEAYLNSELYPGDPIREYSAGPIMMTIGQRTVSIAALTIPPYMDSL